MLEPDRSTGARDFIREDNDHTSEDDSAECQREEAGSDY